MATSQNIAVLGAGIMGLMAARAFSRRGHAVTIYDAAGFPAENASLMAGGMLAPYAEIEHMDGAWIEAGLAGIEAWREIDLDTGFSQRGSLLVACAEDRYVLERFKSHLPLDMRAPVPPQEYEKNLPEKFRNGLFLNSEAHLDPVKTMQALIDEMAVSVSLITETQKPENLKTDIIIDCRGMGAGDPEIRGVKGETLIVHNPEFSLSRPVRLIHPRYPLYIVPRGGGVFMIGATQVESEGGGVQLRSAMELMSALYALHPSFGEAEIVSVQAGLRPSYPDNLPRISARGNVVSCNGLFRHGYLLSPVMAACALAHVEGREHAFMDLFMKGASDENNDQRAA